MSEANKMISKPKIHVIGLGVCDQVELGADTKEAFFRVQHVIGSERQLIAVEHLLQKDQCVHSLPSLNNLPELIQSLNQNEIAILASGDPLFYGIGRWLGQRFSDIQYYPAVSSIQVACHKLGVSLQDVQVVSLHGRPLPTLRRTLRQGRTLLFLTDRHSQPHHLAQECRLAGFEASRIWVCEALGYPQQCVRLFSVEDLLDDALNECLAFDPLHITVIHVAGHGGVLPEFPGIPDADFETGESGGRGMITKREVRLAILSWLQPAAGDVIWDLGAGCGGVAVELALWAPQSRVYAVEMDKARCEYLTQNRDKFGVVDNLQVIHGKAMSELPTLPVANKVFIGGSGGELESMLDAAWYQMPIGGRIVVSAVTEPTRQCLLQFYQQRQAAKDSEQQTIHVAISNGSDLAGQLLYRPNLPVTLFCFIKREQEHG